MIKNLMLTLMFLFSISLGYCVDTVRLIPSDSNGNRPAVLWGNNGYSVTVSSNGDVKTTNSSIDSIYNLFTSTDASNGLVIYLDTNTTVNLSTVAVNVENMPQYFPINADSTVSVSGLVIPPITVTFPEILPINYASSVTVSNLSDLVTSSYVYTLDLRYYNSDGTVKKSSGIVGGIITGVISYTITSADPVCYWQFQFKDEVNPNNICTLSSDYRGVIGKYSYYDYDSGTIEIPVVTNLYLTNLALTTTVQFRVDTRKP